MNTAPAHTSMTAQQWLLLVLLSFLWGGSFFFYKILAAQLPPFTIVFARVALASVLLNLLLAARRNPLPRTPALWRSFFVMGLLNNVIPFSLIIFGETRISSGLASIFNAMTPVFTVLIAHALTDNEKLTRNKMTGILFGFLGVAVLTGPSVLHGGGGIAGEISCLLAAMMYGFAAIYGRRFKGVAPLHATAGQLTASAVISLPLMLFVDQPWQLAMPGPSAWAALAGLVLLSTTVAYMIYFHLLATAGATNIALVTLLLPVGALLLGALFLGEQITAQDCAGMALIAAGLAAIDGRARLWIERRFT